MFSHSVVRSGHLENHVPDVAICEAASVKTLGLYVHRASVGERGELVVVR